MMEIVCFVGVLLALTFVMMRLASSANGLPRWDIPPKWDNPRGVKVRDMIPGEYGYVVPWDIYLGKDEAMISPDALVHPESGGTICVEIRRTKECYELADVSSRNGIGGDDPPSFAVRKFEGGIPLTGITFLILRNAAERGVPWAIDYIQGGESDAN